MKNKIVSYIGFAVKKNAVIFGIDDIIKNIKKLKITLVSSDISENSLDKLKNKNISYYICCDEIFEMCFKNKNVKAISVLDDSLADAIKINLN